MTQLVEAMKNLLVQQEPSEEETDFAPDDEEVVEESVVVQALRDIIVELCADIRQLREQNADLNRQYLRAISLAARLAGLPASIITDISDAEVEATIRAAEQTKERHGRPEQEQTD